MKKEKKFLEFCDICEKIKRTTSKLEKISKLGNFLKELNENDLKIVINFLLGRIFPPWINKEIQIGYSTLVSLILEISGISEKEFSKIFVKHGDLGETAYEIFKRNKVLVPIIPTELTLNNVYNALIKLSEYVGENSFTYKKNTLRNLFISAKPLEVKYIIKIITNEIRIGLSEGLLEESVSYAFNISTSVLRNYYLILPDLGKIATYIKNNRLNEIKIELLQPTNFMLAEPMNSATEIMNYFAKPMFVEFKFDGIRAQIHKKNNIIKIFSRKLEDITFYLPEIVNGLKNIKYNFILDTEILSFKNNKPLPFTFLQKRLRRKYLSENILKEIPLYAIVYDILYFKDKISIKKPLKERKNLIEKLNLHDNILKADVNIVKNSSELEEIFEKSVKNGYEGLMIKDPDSEYTPGKRGKNWIKLKKEFDTLDCVIVAAEYGHGKRAGVLSDYTFAILDKNELKIIGKAYSGLTDDEIEFLDKKLKSLTIQNLGYKIIVKPEIVVEIAFDSIQKSERHDSGFALRFPRIKKLRFEKSVNEIDTIEKVKYLYEKKMKIHF